MSRELFIKAMIKFFSGLIIVGILIFLPAGTFAFWQGWLMMGILFVPMFCAGIFMMIKNPTLLAKRLNVKEQQAEQKEVILFSGIMFLSAFILAGLNHRFSWIVLPDFISYVAATVFLIGYVIYAEVLRENTYLSRTIEVQEGQHVVDSGLYGIVRHPMYMTTVLLFLSMPLVLGSIISFVIMLAYFPIIAKRIKNEERLLEMELKGYAEYKSRVKYKVIPYMW